MQIVYIFLFIFLAIALYTDAKSNKIPNVLNGGGVFFGILYHFILDGWQGLIFSVLGMIVGFGVFLILYLFKAVGAGDVKLFGAIGALTGLEFVLYSSMYSIIYAGLIGLLIVLYKKEVFKRIGKIVKYLFYIALLKDRNSITSINHSDNLHFPFMYAVIPGVITTYYYFFMI